jgi:hypothetical protein
VLLAVARDVGINYEHKPRLTTMPETGVIVDTGSIIAILIG